MLDIKSNNNNVCPTKGENQTFLSFLTKNTDFWAELLSTSQVKQKKTLN